METLRIDGYIGAGEGQYSASRFNNEVQSLSAKSIKIKINSGGGSVVEGWAIHDEIKTLIKKGYEIYTDIIGQCCSIATIIALSAKKENRSMSSNADYGIHFPYWTPNGGEAMRSKELNNLAESMEHEDRKVIDLYKKETSLSETELHRLMDKDTLFTAQQAKEYGFVSEITGVIESATKYKIAAYIDIKTKPTDMEFSASQKSWIETKFNEFTEKFNKVFTPVFKAMMIDLASGDQIFIESEDGEFVGKKAFETDQGKQTTIPAKDGEHKLKDGRTITVAGGIVTAVKEAETVDATALKAEIETLKAELEAEKIKAQTAQTEKTALETSVVALKKEVTEFKNMVLSGDMKGAEQNFKGQSAVKQSENEAWLAYKRAKAEAAKN